MEFGYSDEEVAVAEHFDDFKSLVEYEAEDDYLSYNYNVLEVEPEDDDFFEFNGKFYVKS